MISEVKRANLNSGRASSIVDIRDAALERQLERVMERIKEAQDAETRRVLWGEFKGLHARGRESGKVGSKCLV